MKKYKMQKKNLNYISNNKTKFKNGFQISTPKYRCCFFLFLLFTLNIVSAQNQVFDPFEITPEQVKAKGVKMIQSRPISVEEDTLDYRNYSKEIRAIYFNEEGHPTLEKEFSYEDGNMYAGYDIYYQHEYQKGRIFKTTRERHDFFQYYRKKLIYEGEQLVREEEDWNDDHPREISYTYRADGKLATLKKWRKYPNLEVFSYEGDLLVKKEFYHDEDDELPESVTHYAYSDEGIILQEVEEAFYVDGDQTDTVSLKLYNEHGQLTEYRTTKTYDQYYSQNTPYVEYRFYDTLGQLVRKKMTGGEHGTSYHMGTNEPYFPEVRYQYNDQGQRVKTDSLTRIFHYAYTPFGKLQSKLGVSKKTQEEVSKSTYHYNNTEQLILLEQQDFVEGIHQKWNMRYKDDQLIYLDLFLFNLVRECYFDYAYDESAPAYSVTEYCPVNQRGMPAHLANSVDEFHFDAKGNLISKNHKGGNHDGSLTTSLTDTFNYKNNLIEESIYTQFYQGKVHFKNSEINQYNQQNKLIYTYTLFGQDTVDVLQYFYDGANQRLRSEKFKYSSVEEEAERKPFTITEFMQNGKLEKKSNFDYEEKLRNIQEYEYNDIKLLIRYSVLNSSLERTEHKTYHYKFYE